MGAFKRYSISCVCCIIFSFTACSQSIRINGEFNNIKFPQFVKQAEAGTIYHFYYDEAALDSFTVNIKLDNQTIADGLQQIFKNTAFRYSIDALNHVFIAKNKRLQTTLSSSFFNSGTDTSANENEAIQNEDVKKEKTKTAFNENRLFEIGAKSSAKKSNAIITGFVRDIKNGEALPGSSLYVDSVFTGVITDQFGYYSLAIKPGIHTLEVSSLGMKEALRHIIVYADGKLNVEMKDEIPRLKDVIVTAEKRSNIRSTQMGIDRLSVKTIKDVPVVFGEADILRVVLTLPGVTSVGEASTGFNVRGGSADQNLILFNDATIYNPSHLFGFFSAFNPDIIKNVELYKSSIPEKYGSRLSSVLDVTTRDGNSKNFSGNAGIGPLTSKLTFEGPIVKDRTTFLVSGRTTYSDWVLRNLPGEYRNSSANFDDLDLHLAHTINAKNSLYLTGYLSDDRFRLNTDTLYKYG